MNGQEAAGGGGAIMGGIVALLVMFAVFGVMIAAAWKIFVKAGQPGWAAIVPLYNIITLLNITGKPVWWIALFAVPLVNFYALVMINIALAKCFGKSSGFGVGMAFLAPVFYPMLAFSDARYTTPTTAPLREVPVHA